MYTHIQCTE